MVLYSLGKSTNIDWHVSGRRYAGSPSGPIPTPNIMLNFLAGPSSPPHPGQATPPSRTAASNSDRPALSGISMPAASATSRSARCVAPHFAHFTTGSAKLARCPDASNTDGDITCEPSISIMRSLLTSSRRHSSRNRFLRAAPFGPYSQNPACASAYGPQLGK